MKLIFDDMKNSTQEKMVQTMSKNEVFNATCKLELMQTLLGVLIDMVEEEKIKTVEQAVYFAYKQNVIDDFLHIAFDGVNYAIQILNDLQKDGAA